MLLDLIYSLPKFPVNNIPPTKKEENSYPAVLMVVGIFINKAGAKYAKTSVTIATSDIKNKKSSKKEKN